ncbi:ROK family protein [Chloroflexota bacterium]
MSSLEKSFTSLGIGIVNIISLFDPEIVVVSGGIARAKHIMMDFLNPALDNYVHLLFKNHYRLKFSELDSRETQLGTALLTRLG